MVKYIVGIDFGHGETTASCIEIESTNPFTYGTPQSLLLKNGGNGKKIKSFFCKYYDNNQIDVTQDNNHPQWQYILDPGDTRMSNLIRHHIEGRKKVEFHQSFKVAIGTDETQEALFGEFVSEVYRQIIKLNGPDTSIGLEADDDNKPINYLVYAACPSGWTDLQRDRFSDFLRKNGVPCIKVFKESDAAWISFMPPKIDSLNNPKTLVIDYGSSTIDLTWSEDSRNDICNENELGASRVESDIFDYLIEHDERAKDEYQKVKDYLGKNQNNPTENERNEDEAAIMSNEILKLGLRIRKEQFYTEIEENPDEMCDLDFQGVTLSSIFQRKGGMTSFGDELSFDCVEEILSGYIGEVKEYLRQYRKEHMEKSGKYDKPKEIILTGGASRMYFVAPMVRDIFDVSPVIDRSKASERISDGVAMAGIKNYLLSLNYDIIEELHDIRESLSDINSIQNSIQESISSNLHKSCLQILTEVFDSWQAGEIIMKAENNLNEELLLIADLFLNDPNVYTRSHWNYVKENITKNYIYGIGTPTLHSLFFAIVERIKRLNDDMNLRRASSQEIIYLLNNIISKKINPILLQYTHIYAPDTQDDFINSLIKLDIEYIDFEIDIDKYSMQEFLTSMVNTTYTLIDKKDLCVSSAFTLGKTRKERYRNGYFTDIRNDFEQFSLTLRASIPQIHEYAVQISKSIVSKIQQIQDYCEKLKK